MRSSLVLADLVQVSILHLGNSLRALTLLWVALVNKILMLLNWSGIEATQRLQAALPQAAGQASCLTADGLEGLIGELRVIAMLMMPL